MAEIELNPIKVLDELFYVTVDRNGLFTASLTADQPVAAAISILGLKAAVRKAMAQIEGRRKVVLDIPVVRWYAERSGRGHPPTAHWRDGTIYGVNAGNGALMVRWKDPDETEQVSRHGTDLFDAATLGEHGRRQLGELYQLLERTREGIRQVEERCTVNAWNITRDAERMALAETEARELAEAAE